MEDGLRYLMLKEFIGVDESGKIIYSYVREKKNKEKENMKRIKVGDRVKIVDTKGELESYKELLGHTYTVEAIVIADDTGYECVSLAGTSYAPYLFNCKLVDENVRQFEKSDLKSGDIVELRNGDRYILIKNARHNKYDTSADIFMGINKFGSMPLSWYSDSLLNSNGDKSYDIMKISDGFYIPNIFCTHPSGTLVVPDWVWEREETEEMTLEEVCQELGRDIKIVKEH